MLYSYNRFSEKFLLSFNTLGTMTSCNILSGKILSLNSTFFIKAIAISHTHVYDPVISQNAVINLRFLSRNFLQAENIFPMTRETRLRLKFCSQLQEEEQTEESPKEFFPCQYANTKNVRRHNFMSCILLFAILFSCK